VVGAVRSRDAGRAHRPHPASWPAFPTSAARSRSAARPPPGCELRLHPGAEVSLLDGAVRDCRPGRRPHEENHDPHDSRQRDQERNQRHDHRWRTRPDRRRRWTGRCRSRKRPVPAERDCVSRLPVRDCGSERRRVGGCPVLAFELVGKGAQSSSPCPFVGWEPDGRPQPVRAWGQAAANPFF
jgi:hypothetical protein